jgi:hypothetical protein
MKIWAKRAIRYVLLPLAVLVLLGAGIFVLVVGPWPVYTDSKYRAQAYHRQNLARIDESLARSTQDKAAGALRGGWAERDMTPPVGAPLAGYSDRPNEKRSTSILDAVHTRAIVLTDGKDTVALVGSDLLMTTLNIAQLVWKAVATETPLSPDDILFTSSHSHSGPGGFAPGRLGEYSAGAYSPEIERQIADAISGAIVEAYKSMATAKIAHASLDAPEFIFNRTEVDGVDTSLRYFVVEKATGERCYWVRYSAHPTILPEDSLVMSAEYPGALCSALRERTGAMAAFLGGAVGAMGPKPPKGDDDAARMRRMGEALAERIAADQTELKFSESVDIASLGVRLDMPPMQARPTEDARWRCSPLLAKVVGLPTDGWIQAVKVGDMVFMGFPHDFGGAIANEWADTAKRNGMDLWTSSHCVAYCGYLSPDRYYLNPPLNYDQFYEWYLMSWYGPNQEAMFRDIKDHILGAMKMD